MYITSAALVIHLNLMNAGVFKEPTNLPSAYRLFNQKFGQLLDQI
jgi:hypothetical protein